MTMPGSPVRLHLTSSPPLAFSLARAGAFVLSGLLVLAEAETTVATSSEPKTDRQQKAARLGSINSAPAESSKAAGCDQ
jgi:hypothetical protein